MAKSSLERGRKLIAFRISPEHWLTDGALEALIDFFHGYSDSVDEVAFFTGSTHAPLPLEEMARRYKRLKEAMARTRNDLGLRAGLNVLATMGHHEENLGASLDEPWMRVTDQSGRICLGSFCPSDPRFLDYVRKLYSGAARSNPDFIWVDDDVRLMGHHPVGATCFCDKCVARFSDETGRPWSRRSLTEKLGGSQRTSAYLRKRWLEHNRKVIEDLLGIIRKSVYEVDPNIPLGFMTGDRFYEGYGFSEWTEALRGPEGEVRWRPGGGFYWDDRLLEMMDKGHDIGRQVSSLPTWVVTIQSEIENFPYHRLKKSIRTTMVESVAHMGAGATGIAYNVLSPFSESLEEHSPFLAAISSARPFLESLGTHLGRRQCIGIFPAWNEDMFAAHRGKGSWPEGSTVIQDLKRQYILSEIGLPMCYASQGACATTLSGATPLAFAPDGLEEIFRQGVMLDVGAWRCLAEMGLSHWTGVKGVDGIQQDAIEVFTKHEMNEPYQGWKRDCRQSFWHKTAYRLETERGAEVLSTLSDYQGRELGPCLVAYENGFGGRVVVAGYYPWFLIHNESKSSQIKQMFRWLSRDNLPVVVEDFAKTVVWARGNFDEDPRMVLINASLDTLHNCRITVRASAKSFMFKDLDGSSRPVEVKNLRSGFQRIVIERLDPWTPCLMTPE